MSAAVAERRARPTPAPCCASHSASSLRRASKCARRAEPSQAPAPSAFAAMRECTVRTASFTMSAVMAPSAHSVPGERGTNTAGMPTSRATSAPTTGPAPPKATSAKSRGSTAARERILVNSAYMFDTATRTTLSAASFSVMPSGSAKRRDGVARRASRCSRIRPPRNRSGSRKPRDEEGVGERGLLAAAAVAGRARDRRRCSAGRPWAARPRRPRRRSRRPRRWRSRPPPAS